MILHEYRSWVFDVERYEGNPARKAFYEELEVDIKGELEVVNQQESAAFQGVTSFDLWEYFYLDQDGGTKQIESCTCDEWEMHVRNDEEVWAQYSHFAPPEYVRGQPFEDWKWNWKSNVEGHGGRQMCELCREMRDEIQTLTVSNQDQLLASPMHSVDDVNKALASLEEPDDGQEQHAKLPQTIEARQAHIRDPQGSEKRSRWRLIKRLFKRGLKGDEQIVAMFEF